MSATLRKESYNAPAVRRPKRVERASCLLPELTVLRDAALIEEPRHSADLPRPRNSVELSAAARYVDCVLDHMLWFSLTRA